MAKKICLDAGHYAKYNRCPAIPEYYESEMNWKLHLLLKKELERWGFEVTITREEQGKDLGLQARGKKAKGCDLVLSIHSNAVGSSTGPDGMNEEVDYVVAYVPIDGSVDGLGLALAQAVAEVMGTRQPPREASRKSDHGNWDYYSVIYGAVSVGTPGIILEHSFHTCSRSVEWLLVEENLQKLAVAEAAVLAAWFGLKAPAEPESWYRIRKSWDDPDSQLGAYKDLQLAIENSPEGYSVYGPEGEVLYPDGDQMPAVAWAKEKGIIPGEFSPDKPITQGEAVEMIYRALN